MKIFPNVARIERQLTSTDGTCAHWQLGIVTEASFQRHFNLELEQAFRVAKEVFEACNPKALQLPGRRVLASSLGGTSVFLAANSEGEGTKVNLFRDLRAINMFSLPTGAMSLAFVNSVIRSVSQAQRIELKWYESLGTSIAVVGIIYWTGMHLYTKWILAKDERTWNQISEAIQNVKTA